MDYDCGGRRRLALSTLAALREQVEFELETVDIGGDEEISILAENDENLQPSFG